MGIDMLIFEEMNMLSEHVLPVADVWGAERWGVGAGASVFGGGNTSVNFRGDEYAE